MIWNINSGSSCTLGRKVSRFIPDSIALWVGQRPSDE